MLAYNACIPVHIDTLCTLNLLNHLLITSRHFFILLSLSLSLFFEITNQLVNHTLRLSLRPVEFDWTFPPHSRIMLSGRAWGRWSPPLIILKFLKLVKLLTLFTLLKLP